MKLPVTEYGVYIDGNIRNVVEFDSDIVELAVSMGAPVELKAEAIDCKWRTIWYGEGFDELSECADKAVDWLNENDDENSYWEIENSELWRLCDVNNDE